MDNSQEPIPIIRRPLHEEASDRLRDLIVQGHLAAGARLNERLLTAQLGVSRTPLREAFKVLATEGLVELLPNRGAIVSQLDPVRLSETLAVMGALDSRSPPQFARPEFGFYLRSAAEWGALYRQAGFSGVDAQNLESEQITPDGAPTKRYTIRVTARR